MIGTDLVKLHPQWKIIEDPYSPGEDILLVPATKPDIFLVHAYKADRLGNVITHGYDDRMVAQASDRVIVTTEEIVDYNLAEDPRGGYLVPWPFVSMIVHVPNGAHPGAMKPLYETDAEHMQEYFVAAGTEEGFQAYLDKYIIGHTEEEYQRMVRSRVPAAVS